MNIQDINYNIFKIFDKDWALLTTGNKDKFNTMTISWGQMGTLWNKPVVTVFVKPTRYTSEFMFDNEYFTVSFYDEQYRKDLSLLGSKSGKDLDKVAQTSLVPVLNENYVSFKQAKTTLVLKKIYTDRLKKENIPEFAQKRFYGEDDHHYVFVGELVDII